MKLFSGTMFAALALLATTGRAHAEEWKHELAPYLWGSGMDGVAGVGGVTADVNVSFGEIMENLEFGFMGTYRATKGPLTLMLDGIYMGLGASKRGPGDLLLGKVDLDQTAIEADVGYALRENFTVYAGLRYNDLDTTVQASGPTGNVLSAGTAESWVDPLVGASYTRPFADQWSVTLRGDIGGFGVGSDFAWQGLATLRWQASERTGVLFAYRYVDMDYEDGSDAGYFKYDMTLAGPAMGVVFTF